MKTRSQDAKPTDKSTALTITKNTTNKKKKQQQQQAKVKKMKKRLTADDPKKPKKPPTAFFYYLEDFRKTYQAEHPDVKSMRDIGKACGEKWKTMNFEVHRGLRLRISSFLFILVVVREASKPFAACAQVFCHGAAVCSWKRSNTLILLQKREQNMRRPWRITPRERNPVSSQRNLMMSTVTWISREQIKQCIWRAI